MSWSPSQNRAATRIPGTPHARTTVTTAELLEIPTEMLGNYCYFQAAFGSATIDVAIRFGTSAAMGAVAIADRDVLNTATLAADVNVPHILVVAGTTVEVRLDPSWTHLSHISAATTGTLRFGSLEGV